MMENNIREYIEELFMEAPNTRKSVEMRLELSENLVEKYRAFLAEGKSQEDAYNLTIMSIGDISELFDSLKEPVYTARPNEERERGRTAVITALAVMMYIVSVVPLVLFNGKLSIVMMLLIVALATGMLVYNNMTKSRSHQGDGTVVGDFISWQERANNGRHILGSLSTILWCLTAVLYFLISFSTMKWWITWLIFPIAAALQTVLTMFFGKGRS